MSRTRNQRRRDRIIRRVLLLAMMIAIVCLLIALFKQCAEIEQMQRERLARSDSYAVIRASDYLPKEFDRDAYEDACRRYEIENGHVIPEQKETAPELENSEAADARDKAS